jgi:Fe-S cluster biogenesis protein NfuA
MTADPSAPGTSSSTSSSTPGSTSPSGGAPWPSLDTPDTKIAAILEEIRPYLQQDGGDMEFIRFEDGIVWLRLQGACGTCPSSVMTLKMGIENALREQVPEVQEVRTVDPSGADVTAVPHDHHGHHHPAP